MKRTVESARDAVVRYQRNTVLLVVVGVFVLGVLVGIALDSFSRCPRHSHSLNVQGHAYCFDNGDFNVDGE